MDGKVLFRPSDGSSEVKVGYCSAKLIRRSIICRNFLEMMHEPSGELSNFGAALFDRYGRLKAEFKTHQVKKGTGIWQDELDEGDILFIDRLHIEPRYRRRGFDRQAADAMVANARKRIYGDFFTIIEPDVICEDIRRDVKGLPTKAQEISFEARAREF